ncbi:hypothetical protein C0J52_16720 [Blattella germanica]|nr:hypothetical protein C0J52_16720 [Blattella germanica]
MDSVFQAKDPVIFHPWTEGYNSYGSFRYAVVLLSCDEMRRTGGDNFHQHVSTGKGLLSKGPKIERRHVSKKSDYDIMSSNNN